MAIPYHIKLPPCLYCTVNGKHVKCTENGSIADNFLHLIMESVICTPKWCFF